MMVRTVVYRTDKEIRNKPNPNDDLEMEVAEAEADRVASNILNEFHSEPDFLRAVLTKAAQKMLPRRKKQFSEEEFE
jgi:hypothetical protein